MLATMSSQLASEACPPTKCAMNSLLQRFGTIETQAGLANAMLCMDADRPDEMMLHYYGGQVEAGAVLVNCNRDGNAIKLIPRVLYRSDANGGNLVPANANDPDVAAMATTRAILKEEGDSLTGLWEDSLGQKRGIQFAKPGRFRGVQATPCNSWDEFKVWASRVRSEHDAFTFRGHGSSRFRLSTTFHRVGRHRIERYCAEELPDFKNHAEAILGTRFSLRDGEDFSTLLGLAQHHGLPTPLLDWTDSAYIAAFFAFSDALEAGRDRKHTHVRIYGLTRQFVTETSFPVVTLPIANPYIASLKVSARQNARLYAQQGRFLVTNVGTVEDFILHLETLRGERYLFAADLPVELASDALTDLKYMGLTAASMFPGLDGVCRMMRHTMSFTTRTVKAPSYPDGVSDAPTPTPLQPERKLPSASAPKRRRRVSGAAQPIDFPVQDPPK